MSSFAGVQKILRFNWPWYAVAILLNVVGIVILEAELLSEPWVTIGVVGVLFADFWLISSIAVSHYVYDRSGIARGAWLDGVSSNRNERVALLHAGQDEASEVVARRLPDARVEAFDFFDPQRVGSPSLRRARQEADRSATEISADRIPLADGALDLGLIVFAAHEIRDDDARAALFGEVARVLRPDGRALVVEHLRDGWNFLAYGPGAFHFLSRATWHGSFAAGGMELVCEASCTPFVRVFELKNAT